MAKDDFAIGYKKPPVKSQFKKGTSGNPKGRPKGSLSISSVLMKTGREQVSVTINGKTRIMTKLEAASMQLHNKAASGDLRAVNLTLAAHRQFPEPEDPIRTSEVSKERDDATFNNLLERIRVASSSTNSKSRKPRKLKESQ